MRFLLLFVLAAPAPPPPKPPPPLPPNYEPAAVELLTKGSSKEPLEVCKELRQAMREVALRWEILDAREVRYMLTDDKSFTCDLKLLRQRYNELKDAPPLYWSMAFPDRNLVNQLMEFNRAYKTNLEWRLLYDLPNAWTTYQVILETDALWKIWALAKDTGCDYYYITVRRRALKELREKLGDQAFYSGVLPPHVPIWRFRRLDP